jgi:hypothetical protein
MENLIFEFLNLAYGDGDGNGFGNGNAFGIGYGLGYGDSDVFGNGSGYGLGDGDGDVNGEGSGSGFPNKINYHKIYDIDDVNTIIYTVKSSKFGQIAKGAIVNMDLSLTKCFIVKQDNVFAHGSTIKQAYQDLQNKLFDNMDIDERIELFINEFDLTKSYPAMTFFDWHGKLTNSCLLGRTNFVKNHNINLDKDMFTVAEFISLTESDHKSDIMKLLKERIGNQ